MPLKSRLGGTGRKSWFQDGRHLLEKKTPPQCNLCQCSLSVEHILTVCLNYGSIRSKCFHGNNVKEILHVQNISNLIKFAVESGLSSQI